MLSRYRRYFRLPISKGTDFRSFYNRLSKLSALSPSDAELGAQVLEEFANEDTRTALIRAHAYVDSSLRHLIRECLPEPRALDIERISFALKVQLAIALGIVPTDFEPPLKKLNSLRNKIAHQVKADITDTDAKNLFGCFSLEDRTAMDNDWNLRSQLSYIHGCLYGQLKRIRQGRSSEL